MKRLDGSRLEGTAERVRRSHHEAIEELQNQVDRVARGHVDGATGALSNGKNVVRVERTGTGTYVITLAVAFDPDTRWIDVQVWDGSGGCLLQPSLDNPRQFRVFTFDTSAVALQDATFRFRVEE